MKVEEDKKETKTARARGKGKWGSEMSKRRGRQEIDQDREDGEEGERGAPK